MPRRGSALILAILMVLLAASVGADEPADPESKPKIYTVSLYGWLMAIEGDFVSPDGTENEFSIPFDEIFSRLESVLQASLEVDIARWYLIFDGTWATFAGGYDASLWALDLELKQQIYDIKAGYDLYRRVESDSEDDRPGGWVWVSTVDVLVGARYFGSRTTTTETSKLSGESKMTEAKQSRWDPVIGARGAFPFSRRWALNVIADLGGFGIGNAAEFTYQLDASVSYRFSPTIAAFAGYRHLGYSFESEADVENLITQRGPRVGLSASF